MYCKTWMRGKSSVRLLILHHRLGLHIGGCCNSACRRCQTVCEGGKACIAKHGCSGKSSSTSTNTAPSTGPYIGGCCNSACRRCQTVYEGGKACIAKHGCSGKSSSTSTNTAPSTGPYIGGCCNSACRRCQTVYEGGKACIAKHGCSGKSSSTSTNTAPSTGPYMVDVVTVHVDDAKRFMKEVKHVLQNMDALSTKDEDTTTKDKACIAKHGYLSSTSTNTAPYWPMLMSTCQG